MKNQDFLLSEAQQKFFNRLGERIRVTRLNRKISVQELSRQADISRPTLWKIEKGCPCVAIGSYVRVLHILKLQMYVGDLNSRMARLTKPSNKIMVYDMSI